MWRDVALFLAAYLLGSVPFAYLLTKVTTGRDLRLEHEGNVGTRNAWRTAGPLAGALTLLMDGGKGAAAYWVGRRWGTSPLILYWVALGLMLGHGFPVWLGWRGGKGLAAACGFLAQIWPLPMLGATAIFLAARLLVPSFDLSFAIGALAFFIFTLLAGNDLAGALLIVFTLGLAGLKRLVDLPYERRILASHNHAEGPLAQHHPHNGC